MEQRVTGMCGLNAATGERGQAHVSRISPVIVQANSTVAKFSASKAVAHRAEKSFLSTFSRSLPITTSIPA